jgi:malate dehydrogenase (oxaloacetate-decarboxylating)
MATTSPGYSITVRAEPPSTIGATADLAAAVMAAGGSMTALDVLESGPDLIVVDVTCDAIDAAHADEVTRSIDDLPGVSVRKVSDRTFLLWPPRSATPPPDIGSATPPRASDLVGSS